MPLEHTQVGLANSHLGTNIHRGRAKAGPDDLTFPVVPVFPHVTARRRVRRRPSNFPAPNLAASRSKRGLYFRGL